MELDSNTSSDNDEDADINMMNESDLKKHAI